MCSNVNPQDAEKQNVHHYYLIVLYNRYFVGGTQIVEMQVRTGPLLTEDCKI